MGKHVINGIDYSGGSGGGGGDNSVEILYADYLALSDAERNNGTIYYITDANPVSVGDEPNMKYDPETDKKYLKNQAGEWVEVGYGGLLYKYLYSNGNQYSDITGGWTGTGTYNVNSDGKLYVAATNGQSTLYTSNANMDLTGYKYLEIVYTANIVHKLSTNYARIKLMNGNSEIATKSFDSATTENNTWRIDLLSNQAAVSACQIKVEIAESGTSEIYISEVRLITN